MDLHLTQITITSCSNVFSWCTLQFYNSAYHNIYRCSLNTFNHAWLHVFNRNTCIIVILEAKFSLRRHKFWAEVSSLGFHNLLRQCSYCDIDYRSEQYGLIATLESILTNQIMETEILAVGITTHVQWNKLFQICSLYFLYSS